MVILMFKGVVRNFGENPEIAGARLAQVDGNC